MKIFDVHSHWGTRRGYPLRTEAELALQTSNVRNTLAGLGFEIAGGTPEQAAAFLRSEMKKWAEVVAATGIKAQ